jgi:hypothetical protein
MTQELRAAVRSAWWMISAILLAVILAPYLFSENSLLAASGALQVSHAPGETCGLCGMTRAFLAISRGDFSEAVRLNGASVILFGIILANELWIAFFLTKRIWKYASGVNAVERQTSTRKELESCRY